MLLALVAVQPPAAAQSTVFTDMAGDVFEGDVQWMIDEGALTAADSIPDPNNGLFRPHERIASSVLSVWLGRLDDSTTDLPGGQGQIPSGRSLSRMEAAHVIAEYFDLLPHGSSDHPFTDMGTYSVADNRVVDAIYDAGITFGSTGTTYDPGEAFSRGQAAAMLHRGFGITQTFPSEDCDVPWSNKQLVGGVCVEACPLSGGLLPYYDSDGVVLGCNSFGDCPYDLFGFDPDRLQYFNYRGFDPLWLGAPDVSPVEAGQPSTVERTVLKCPDYWRTNPLLAYTPIPHYCIWNEENLSSQGHCLQISMSVDAVMPAVTGSNPWEYRVSGCGHNRSASRPTWTQDDTVCSSSDAAWTAPYNPHGFAIPVLDTGDWTITLDELTAPSNSRHYVDVPLLVNVTDWGDASHLRVTITATPTYLSWSGTGVYAQWTRPGGASDRTDTIYMDIPRRSGLPPSDDTIDVNVAELASSSQQYVDILRTELLANDTCPVGTDCSEPTEWPVDISDGDARSCVNTPFGGTPMSSTDQGVVGCDNLNDDSSHTALDPGTARYWPRLWAEGTDTFTYSTYGGEATVTVEFTDQKPLAADIVTHDPGTMHTVTTFDSPSERSYYYSPPGCYTTWCSKWRYVADYTRSAGMDWQASRHSGLVPLDGARDSDPDDDTASIVVTDGYNPHLTGNSGIVANADNSARNYSHWRTDETAPALVANSPVCGWAGMPPCATRAQLFAYFFGNGNTAAYRPVNPVDGTQPTSDVSVCVADADTVEATRITSYQWLHDTYPDEIVRWSAPVDTDPACIPSSPAECSDVAMLQDWSMCYALWPNAANPDPLIVDYRVCDSRQEAARSDRTAFSEYMAPFVAPVVPHLIDSQVEHLIRHRLAGNSGSPAWPYYYDLADWNAVVAAVDAQLGARYCDEGTITVLLGDTSTVSMQPTATATEGLSLGFVVTLDQPTAVDVTVTFSTRPDTAGTDPAEASDYRARTDAQVTIPAGQTQAPAEVLTVQDSIYENDETLRVVVTAADAARLGADLEAVGTIVNDDSQPVVGFAADATADEDVSIPLNPPFDINGDGILDTEYVYGDTIRFAVTLTGESDLPVTVSYDTETTPGTATSVSYCQQYPGSATEDYRSKSSSLTFNPGDASKTITVTLCPDDQYEGDETLIVTLSNPTNATLGTASATGTIIDNEAPPLTPLQQCELLHGPGWAAVLHPDDTPWTDSNGQIVCAMPH